MVTMNFHNSAARWVMSGVAIPTDALTQEDEE
jgi:hypothetical protein